MPITSVQVHKTPEPRGHYSQAVVYNGLVFVSGLLPMDLESGLPNVGTIEAQTELVLRNLDRILGAAGSGLDRLLQVTLFLTNMEDWGVVNATYARILGRHRPSRAVAPVLPLAYGAGIAIQAIAAAAEPSS